MRRIVYMTSDLVQYGDVLRGAKGPIISRFARHFSVESRDRGDMRALCGESPGIAFAHHLVKRYGSTGRGVSRPRG
jgi:hypothetical protein